MNIQQIKSFVTAGKAIFTLESLKTGQHYTFRARKASNASFRSTYDRTGHTAKSVKTSTIFISLLTAPDTYTYMGTVFVANNKMPYRTTQKSRNPEGKIHTILTWFFEHLAANHEHKQLLFRHAGRCGRCGHRLTTPASIDSGIGPICAGRG